MFDEFEHAWERIFDRTRAGFINISTQADGIGDVTPNGRARLFKLAQQKSFLRTLREEDMQCFQMGAGHGKNMRGAIDQLRCERLAPKTADVYAVRFAYLHGIEAWRLAANGMDPGGGDLDVFSVPQHISEEAFRDGAATNIARTDEEDVFHGRARKSGRIYNLGSN